MFLYYFSFISTMLTAILTHHLGWVGTVAPLSLHTSSNDLPTTADQLPSSPASNAFLTASLARLERAKMSEISKFHPYNVLWAQMSDLYGAIGNPPKLSKTVVCGSQEPFVEKVLNVLTYFIRCGQIERDVRTEEFEKDVVEHILDDFTNANTQNSRAKTETPFNNRSSLRLSGKGMVRSATCIKDLTAMVTHNDDADAMPMQTKMNDIPNVLIFRDSRFVKQELRIGNTLMDTGIEMTRKQRSDIRDYRVKNQSEVAKIRVMVTSPELEEFAVNDAASNSTDDTVEEATENYIGPDNGVEVPTSKLNTSPSLSDLITANSLGGIGEVSCSLGESSSGFSTGTLLWGTERVKEGVSAEQWQHIEKGQALNLRTGHCLSDGSVASTNTFVELKRSKSLFTKSSHTKNTEHLRRSKIHRQKSITEADTWDSEGDDVGKEDNMENMDPAPNSKLKTYPSLSDLITANSCGASDRLTWGIEMVKEGITLDEIQHFQNAQKRIEDNSRKDPGVVFVLGGDNETLANLKHSSSFIKCEEQARKAAIEHSSKPSASLAPTAAAAATRKTCSHKKHSGVKFNFEKYPQIATNYMKNKNIDLAHYDFIEKGLKLDEETSVSAQNDFALPGISTEDSDSSECECCAGNATRLLLQTPSNATELEFNNDDNNYPTSTAVASTSSLAISSNHCSSSKLVTTTVSSSSVATEDSVHNIKLITLPLSKCIFKNDSHMLQQQFYPAGPKNGKGSTGAKTLPTKKMPRPGFIPSLFVGITDHFIADMVLQVSVFGLDI